MTHTTDSAGDDGDATSVTSVGPSDETPGVFGEVASGSVLVDDEFASPTSEVISGTRWGSGSQVLIQLLRLVTQIVLARILAPSAFGVITLGLTFVTFLDLFKDMGTVTTLIQRPVLTHRLVNSMFIVNIVVGVSLTALFAVSAPWLAPSGDTEDSVAILRVLGCSLAISSVALVHQALVRRARRFGRMAGINMVQAITSAVIPITLAAMGMGAWSLVWGTLASAAVAVVMSWQASKFRPNLDFAWTDVKDVSGFSMQITGFNIFNYLFQNADKVIVGRTLGATSLGLYALGQRVLMYPVGSVTLMIQNVLLPTFARMSDNKAIGRGYLRACAGIAMLTFPSMAGITLLAGPFVLTVFGPQWKAAIPIVAILAPIGLLHSLHFTVGPIYAAKGAGRLLLLWGVGSGLLTVIGYLAGLPWGITGVAAGYAVVVVVITYPTFAIPFKLIDLHVRELWIAVWPYAWMTGVMCAAVGAARIGATLYGANDAEILFGCSAVGALVYSGLIALRRPAAVKDLLLVLKR